jgi:hypothetical protein
MLLSCLYDILHRDSCFRFYTIRDVRVYLLRFHVLFFFPSFTFLGAHSFRLDGLALAHFCFMIRENDLKKGGELPFSQTHSGLDFLGKHERGE